MFPFGSFAKPGGFVAEDGQEGDAFGFDEFGDEFLDVEGGVVAVEFADL